MASRGVRVRAGINKNTYKAAIDARRRNRARRLMQGGRYAWRFLGFTTKGEPPANLVWKPFSRYSENGGVYGTRTRNLRRDRAAL